MFIITNTTNPNTDNTPCIIPINANNTLPHDNACSHKKVHIIPPPKCTNFNPKYKLQYITNNANTTKINNKQKHPPKYIPFSTQSSDLNTYTNETMPKIKNNNKWKPNKM